jgi:putative endonuclease
MFYTYILQSQKDGSFYIGYTQDLMQRLEKHNTGKTGYTATKQPWSLVYQEGFDTKTDAMKREKFLKAQKNRDFYVKLIASASSSSVG